jgi:hypothetical protein
LRGFGSGLRDRWRSLAIGLAIGRIPNSRSLDGVPYPPP